MNKATEATKKLIEAVVDTRLELMLLSGTPMHKHNITKHWSRLDQVFLLKHSSKMLISCDTLSGKRGINMDHLPVLTELRLKVDTMAAVPILNFCNTNWKDFRAKLQKQLDKTPNSACILD
jgi:hypothetical protein